MRGASSPNDFAASRGVPRSSSRCRAAAAGVRRLEAARVVVAVPAAAAETCELLAGEADEVVCLTTPEPFYAVGLWYEDFSETSDDEVRRLLDAARPGTRPAEAV